MDKKIKGYTIRKRKTARRWELHIRDPKGLGAWLYGGLWKTFDEAVDALRKNWGMEPSEDDLLKQEIIRKNIAVLANQIPNNL